MPIVIIVGKSLIGVITMKTEEEIMKGLDSCCVTHNCKNCPYLDVGMVCIRTMQSDALNLIKRQQAEIERLNTENNKSFDKWIILEERTKKRYAELYQEVKAVVRAEAVREFAERLKGMKYESIGWSHGEHPYVVEEGDIDDLVEEMVGEK